MDIRSILKEKGAVISGNHFFALKSGKVVLMYVNIDPIFTFPSIVHMLGEKLIEPFVATCEAIVAPAVGGIPLVYAAERAVYAVSGILRLDPDSIGPTRIRTAWADKKPDGTFEFERMGFREAIAGKRVVILEDITTTGDSMGVTAALAKEAGATIIGASCIWNRGGVTAEALGVPEFYALVAEGIPSWQPGEHPEWGRWPLVSDVGHPDRYPNYPGGMVSVLS